MKGKSEEGRGKSEERRVKSEEFDSPSKEDKSKFENSKLAESRQFNIQNSYSPGHSLPSPTGRGKPRSGVGVGL